MAVAMVASGGVVIDQNMTEWDRVHWRNMVVSELRQAKMDLTLKGGHFPLVHAEHNSEKWHYERGEVPRKYELYVRHNEHGGMHQIERSTLRDVCITALRYLGGNDARP